jgi:hypothetical protein
MNNKFNKKIMPFQIQLYVDNEYEKKKNSLVYSIYCDIKYMFINPKIENKVILIKTCNTISETIYETFHYLVINKYGGLCFNNFVVDFHNDLYSSYEKLFLEQVYLYYYDNDKNTDLYSYTTLKFIEFLSNQTDTIHEIHTTCLKYCDDTYISEWSLEFECTE